MSKKGKCLADGAVPGPDGLTDAQRAKRNAALQSLGMNAGSATAQPVPQPSAQPTPQPLPQPQGIAADIIGVMKGRQQQIDKASGYAAGGIVRGKGGIDNVPMSIGGVKVNLTGGKKPEAVLPGKTVESLGGPRAVERLIEETNGRPPVRDGLKAGGKYAGGLVIDEEDPRLKPYGAPSPQLGSGLYGTASPDAKQGVPSPTSFSNGRDATGVITGDSAQSMASSPMQRSGGISGSIDMAGVNGILSRENKARGEMIDSMVRASGGNGGATIGEVAPGKTQNDLDNAEKTARWRQEDLIGKLGRGYDGAIAAAITANARSADVAGTNAAQLQSAELQNQTARYGHDVNALRTAESNRIQMRGQDLAASEAAARTGIDRERLGITREDSARAGERFGLEKTKTQGEIDDQRAMRDARSGLVSALASGDSNAINAARAKATAAGLKFDHPQQEFVTATDSMGMNVTRTNKGTGAIDIIDGKTGKVKASIPGQGAPAAAQAPIPPGHTLIGTSGGKRVFKDAQGNRFVEGN